MIEKIINLLNNEDLDGIKKLIKKNYDEIGELIYNICVSANELNEETLNSILVVLKVLIDNDHKCDYEDSNGNTALLAAVKSQIPEIVMLFNELDELFVKENKDSITPVSLSYTLSDDTIKMLCTTKIKEHVNDIFSINGENNTYFSLAILTSVPAISKLIATNDDFDFNIHKEFLEDIEWDESPEDQEKYDLIQNLEDNSFFEEDYVTDNENKNLSYSDICSDSIIYEKFANNDLDDIEDYLNDTNVEYEIAGFTPLNLAIAMQDEELVDKLLKYASVNHRTTSGITPVLAACVKGNKNILKKLIERGADLSTPLYNGTQPIFYTVFNKYFDVFKMLLDSGVYIDEYNKDLILGLYDDDEHKKYIDLIKRYKNPTKPKVKYPFEDNYELGCNPTYETDGYHGVKYVHNTSIGSRMISTEFGANGAFGMPMLLPDVEISEDCIKIASPFNLEKLSKEETDAFFSAIASQMNLSKEETEQLLNASTNDVPKLVGFLTKKGKVIAYNTDTNEKYEKTDSWSNIVDIASTEFNLIGLCSDGTIKVVESEYYQFYEEVLKWKNIKKIATGTNCIYAIDDENNFYFAASDMVKNKLGDEYNRIINIKKAKHVNACLEYVVITDMDDNLIPINCDNKIKFVKNVKEISCSYNNIIILKQDGTLLAFGNNDLCTCNISKWHDIDRIQSTLFSTIGYAKDGEILSTENMSCGRFKWSPGFGNMTHMDFSGHTHNVMNL